MDIVSIGQAVAQAMKKGDARYSKQTDVGLGTKPAVYVTGTAGATTSTTNAGGIGSLRLVCRLPVTPTRFRIKLRNYDTVAGATQTALAGQGISIGPHTPAADGFETGNITGGTLTPLAASGYTIPGDGTWYTSPWFTAANYQINPLQTFVIAHGYNAGGSVTLPRGVGQAWHTTDLTLLTGTTTAPGTPMANTPIEMQIEYEFVGTRRIGLFIGDSITEGLGGQSSLANLPYFSWPAQWADRNNAVAINIGVSGSTASSWVGATGRYWTRVDLTRIAPDFVYVGLGANDANSSTSLATFQTNMEAVIGQVRTMFGASIPIYTGNITPRSFDGTREALRVSYNNWLEGMSLQALQCFDFDTAVRDSTVLRVDTVTAGTLQAATSIGATSITSSIAYPPGTLLSIDTSTNQELAVVTGVSGSASPYTLTLRTTGVDVALTKAHASGVALGNTSRLQGAPTSNNVYSYDGTHYTRRGYNRMAQVPGRLYS